ncbi:trypsin-like peptidase domain-containing protein [Dactylosporangium matsuzakiense]|uniref:Novel STAND NTPase 1 domain-containing protein n=1 Tax=Dactylosporangium matsuzakiense TaxID=53360 RepID=A0A9W6KY50_9ACTN|nr:trypsin-like peptidase domain-containing protein [Dactylosporangium matsuzakiense]UWZ42403.1 trypsin-like peptidase domain-containing protein [Dactylosporangium matsuzakiense]GLL07614.1 hypothetical protein GCM10017581_093680 [Dactylosporangium matsuzakiense]
MADAPISPAVDSWVAAIHRSEHDFTPIGAGFVVDDRHVLTCEHILRDTDALLTEVWVSFPKAGVSKADRRRSVPLSAAHIDAVHDIAMIRLEQPVPAAVKPAPLRVLDGKALRDGQWWAFGFPNGDVDGISATGRVADDLGNGRVLLEATSHYKVEPGFSGGPLWSPAYEAVVGLIVERRNDGNGKALTLLRADHEMPHLRIAKRASWRAKDADGVALDAWGWSLINDPEMGQHWLPKARGTVDASESGRFRGRSAALQNIVDWLDRPAPDGRVLVVTGSPGVGKSAVLGRIITTADEDIRKHLADDDDAVRATVGAVHCAVHAKGKTALEIAAEVARGASVALPTQPGDVILALRRRLDFPQARFNLIVDALDEAVSPVQARKLLDDVLKPLAAQCADVGVQVIIGSRRADDAGDLLARLADAVLIDLDNADYFAEADLAAYARVTLRQASEKTNSRAYTEDSVAGPVADRIAALSAQNFLVAGLTALTYGQREGPAILSAAVAFTPTVGAALAAYIHQLRPVGRAPAELVLSVLAHAEAPGLPLPLWRTGIAAFGGTVSEEDLLAFAHGAAANFLVETGAEHRPPAFRLFHQALNDALLPASGRASNERKLLKAWLDLGRESEWRTGADYLRRSLPTHAVRADDIDTLLADDEYLLHGDLRRLTPAAERARTDLGKARAALLHGTPLAGSAGPAERAAMFSVVERLDGLASDLPPFSAAPYRALWARTPPRLERTVLDGHAAPVFSVCSFVMERRPMLASGGEDRTVRVWDATTGQLERLIQFHEGPVRSVCGVIVDGRTLLASAGQDGVVVLCDPRTGVFERVLQGHTDWVRAICAVPGPDCTWLASVSDDRTLRIWDPATGRCECVVTGSTGWLTTVCAISGGAGTLVAFAGYDGVIRLWDAAQSSHVDLVLDAQAGWITSLCPMTSDSGRLLASTGYDGAVRVWDVDRAELITSVEGDGHPMTGLCAVEVEGSTLLAATNEAGEIRLSDPLTGSVERILTGHTDRVRGVCAVTAGNRSLLASVGDDGTVRVWDPRTGHADQVIDGGRVGPVYDICVVPRDGVDLLATTAPDGLVRLWDPATGDERHELPGHPFGVTSICAFSSEHHFELAVASGDSKVRLWDIDGGQIDHVLDATVTVTVVCTVSTGSRELLATAGEDESVWLWDGTRTVVDRALGSLMSGQVTAMCPIPRDGYELLAWATDDGTIRLWDTVERRPLWERHAHVREISGLCHLNVRGQSIIATSSTDKTIRLWSPEGGAPIREPLQGHTGPVRAVCALPTDDGELLVSVSDDRTVRIWDPLTGDLRQVIPVHHVALSCAYNNRRLLIGLDVGLLCIQMAAA